MRQPVLLPLFALLGVTGAPAPAAQHRPTPEEAECIAIVERLGVSRVLEAVQPTSEQKQLLVRLGRERMADLEAIEKAKIAAEPAVLPAMARLRTAVMANNGVSEEVKRAVRQAEAPYKKLLEELEGRDEQRAAAVLAVLDERQKQAARGKTGVLRFLLSPTGLSLLDPAFTPSAVKYTESEELRATVADIRVLNLVNTLYLNAQQTRTLVGLIGKATAEREAIGEKLAEHARTYLPKLRAISAASQWPAGRSRAFRDLAGFTRGRAELLKEARAAEARYLADVKSLLTPNQVSMVANFVPCTVPVQSLTNPERVGQVGNNTALEKALDRIRMVPPRALPRTVERLETSVREHFKKKRYDDEAISGVVARIPKIVEAVRSADEADYRLKRSQWAEELAVPAKIAEGAELDRRMVTYLLAPNLAQLLQPRLAQMERQ